MKKSRLLLTAGFLFLVAGVAMSYGPIMQYWRSKHAGTVLKQPFTSVVHPGAPADKPVVAKSGKPVHLTITSVGVDLTVIDGVYDAKSQTWTLTKDKAQYAMVTPLANNTEGNTFIYGHNRVGVLHTLNRIKTGDEAVVKTDNGLTFTYKFVSAYETNPNDDTLFHYQGPPILTIQTCSGLWFQNRQLFTFDLESVS